MKIFIRYLFRQTKMYFVRKRYRLKNVHNTFYSASAFTRLPYDLVAGCYSFIGPNCVISKKTSIGNYTMIANNVLIVGGDHVYNRCGTPTIFAGRDVLKNTDIGADVWIGAGTIIMTGVSIGDGSIIAAGSVVTKDVEPFSIYVGVPAKFLRKRFVNKDEEQKHRSMLTTTLNELKFNYKNLC